MATQAQRLAWIEARLDTLDRYWQSNWVSSPSDGGWSVQEKVPGCDLQLSQELTDGYDGREAWWAHSIKFPYDFVPGNAWYVAADFHNTSNDGVGQANFHVDACRWDGGILGLRGYGEGTDWSVPNYESKVEKIVKNKWYDFVYHVLWSSDNGFFHSWVNGKRYLSYQGPTLYAGQGVYWKLANYHETNGQPSSVIHDRIVRGKTWQSVALTLLEGIA
jgi:hypothetical protein